MKIAATDHKGDGVPLLLTHGFGGVQSHLDPLVRRLTPQFRVVTFDMRNHGESDDGEWTWPNACADIAEVSDRFGLDRPVVGGHSLGGMVGVLFAEAHPERTRGVINLDGHGMGRPEQFVDMTVDEVVTGLARLRTDQMALQGEPKAALAAMNPAVEALYMFDHYANVQCPQLIFNATGPDPMVTNVESLAWAAPLMAAYRAGLARDFAALAAAHPSIEIETLPDAAHYLIFTHADRVAARMTGFVSALEN